MATKIRRLQIYDKLLAPPLPSNSAIIQILKTSYTYLLDITTIIARYAVMEDLYQQSHGTLSLTSEYQSSLISLCSTILTYFVRAFQIGRRPVKDGPDVNLLQDDTVGIVDSLVNEIKMKDRACQGSRVVVEAKEDSESENEEAEVEDWSESDDSWEQIDFAETRDGFGDA